MLRERCHRCSSPRPYPHPPGDSRPGPLSLSAEPSNIPRLPPSIPFEQPPTPTSPGQAPSCGRAGLQLSPQRRPPRGQEQRRGERDAPVTWCWAGAGGGLSAFVPQTSRWRRGAWPALLAPERPALPPASPLAGRAPPRADWAPPAPLLLGERGRGVEVVGVWFSHRISARRVPFHGEHGERPAGERGRGDKRSLPVSQRALLRSARQIQGIASA